MLITQYELTNLFGKDIGQQIQVLSINKNLPKSRVKLKKHFSKNHRGKSITCESLLTVNAWDIRDINNMLQQLIDNRKVNTAVSRWKECIKKLVGELTNTKAQQPSQLMNDS